MLLLYNFFSNSTYIYNTRRNEKTLILWSKIIFTFCRKFSSEKVFLLFTTRYYFISSQITNIYLTLYFSLVAICQWPLSSLRIPPDQLLCIPTRASPRKNFYPIPQEPPTWQALHPNRTAKVIPFYYTTKLFTNFFWEKEKFIANRLNDKLFKEQIIFEFFQILIGEVANLAKIVYTL